MTKNKRIAKKILERFPFRSALLKGIRAVWHPPENIYRHLHFRGTFGVGLPDGGQFYINHYGNQVENDLFWAGFGQGWEGSSLLLWLWLARQSAAIIDVGANTGIYALSAQAVNPGARVAAFEPVKRVYERLAANIALNGYGIDAHHAAISERSGMLKLYDPGGEHAYSASLNLAMSELTGASEECEVKTITLDDFMAGNAWCGLDLLKIDVEMHEPEVIAGARKTIETYKPIILVELLNEDIARQVIAALPGYKLFEIHEGEGLLIASHFGVEGDRNYLAVPEEHTLLASLGGEISHCALKHL